MAPVFVFLLQSARNTCVRSDVAHLSYPVARFEHQTTHESCAWHPPQEKCEKGGGLLFTCVPTS